MADVELLVNNLSYSGWTEVSVSRSLEAIAGAFEIKAVNKGALDIIPGDSCSLLLHGQAVISGYIDSINYSISNNAQSISISGRDKTGDLVDSSAANSTGEFLNITLKELITKIIEPYGITAFYKTTLPETRSKVSLQQDTAFDVIDRETRKAGFFAYPDGLGNLIIDKIGSTTTDTALELGKNIMSFDSKIDFTERFSHYIVKGQSPSSDDSDAEADAKVVATGKDLNISRYRPLIVLAETGVTTQQAQDRVKWEAAVRAARSEEISVTTQGWIQASGALWPINAQCDLTVSTIGYKATKLIKSINCTLDLAGGTISTLILVDKDSYLPENEIPKKKKGDYTAPVAIDPTLKDFDYRL